MEHEKQVEVVKQALELETQIQVLEQFLPEERAETYAEPEPQPPARQEAHYTEPPIRHGCKVNWLLMLGLPGSRWPSPPSATALFSSGCLR